MRKRDYSIPTTTRAAPATRTARAARRARLARFGALLAGVVFSLALIRRAATTGRVSTVATEKAAVASEHAFEKQHKQSDGAVWVEHLSWEPRASLLHNFLTPAECDHLWALAKPYMARSTVVDNVSGERQPSKVRTSSGMFLQRGQDDVVKTIEDRIARFTAIPVENGEGLQVLNYQEGELYEPHFDYFHEQHNQANGGQRIATMLMYLSDVDEGGETVFPSAPAADVASLRRPGDPPLSDCAKAGLAVRPRKGDALLFYSLQPDGELDKASLHGGCPVIRGAKISATKWLRVGEYKV